MLGSCFECEPALHALGVGTGAPGPWTLDPVPGHMVFALVFVMCLCLSFGVWCAFVVLLFAMD